MEPDETSDEHKNERNCIHLNHINFLSIFGWKCADVLDLFLAISKIIGMSSLF